MSGQRIVTMQRTLRELGRIRSGYSEAYVDKRDGREKSKPVRSKTFILTSHQREYLDVAAELWGGTVERWQPLGAGAENWRVITDAEAIDAILPPGDPLSQRYELWNKGGAVRRCDGEVDEKSGGPCVCKRQFGEDWFERDAKTVCRPFTRLNVFLQLLDFGYWRIETKSFYAAMEMTGTVDLIKSRIGPEFSVPVRLRIEPRQRVQGGTTTPYPVIVIELRGVATAQILAGVAPTLQLDGVDYDQAAAIGAAPRARAIEAPPSNGGGPTADAPTLAKEAKASPAQWRQWFTEAKTLDELRSMWTRAGNDGALDDETRAAYKTAGDTLLPPSEQVEPPADTPDWAQLVAAAATVADLRAVWEQLADAKVNDAALKAAWWERKAQLDAQTSGRPAPEPEAEAVTGEVEPDRDEAWTKVLTLAGRQGWNTAKTSQLMREHIGKDPSDADGWDFFNFAQAISSGLVAA